MAFLLDTNVLSEPQRPAPSGRVVRWLEDHDRAGLNTSVLVFGELYRGAALLPPGRRAFAYWTWLTDLEARMEASIIPVDLATARTWGELDARQRLAGTRKPFVDLVLAATALVHNLTIVTRNTRDFDGTGVEVVNPWDD